MEKQMIRLAQILLTVAAIQYGVVPPFVGLTESHVFHEGWPPHARFHMVWLLTVSSLSAAYVAGLVWSPAHDRRARLRYASVIGWIVLAGFFTATYTQASYGGALSDPDHAIMVLGIDGNTVAFSIAAVFQALATLIVWMPQGKRVTH